MATKRTISALNALFENGQAAGSITPERVQDLILTLRGAWGRISLTGSPVETTIANQNEWTKIAGSTVLGDNAISTSMPANGRLACDCPVPAIAVVEGVVNMQASSNNQVIEVGIAKNGTVDTTSIGRVRLTQSASAETVPVKMDFTTAEGDYLEVFARNATSAANVTAINLYLSARMYTL